jgi:hypothetical protein
VDDWPNALIHGVMAPEKRRAATLTHAIDDGGGDGVMGFNEMYLIYDSRQHKSLRPKRRPFVPARGAVKHDGVFLIAAKTRPGVCGKQQPVTMFFVVFCSTVKCVETAAWSLY